MEGLLHPGRHRGNRGLAQTRTVGWYFSLTLRMATYIYETIPHKRGSKPRQFEVKQSMKDPALTRHPETGEPIRRVIAGGYGVITQRAQRPAPPCGASRECEGGCGCRE